MKPNRNDRKPLQAKPVQCMFDAVVLVLVVLAALSIRQEPREVAPGKGGGIHAASNASVESVRPAEAVAPESLPPPAAARLCRLRLG